MDVAVVSVPVRDQEAAVRFWTGQVGLQVLADAEFAPGMRWVQVGAPGSGTSLSLVTWFEQMPPGSLQGVVFEVDDVDAAFARLSAVGVPVEGPPSDEAWGRQAVFRDPDGNGFVLSSRSPAPA
ncbi:catechol 2,3-dioxygenase-like lactoylglutathione lyase family enzyme [Geodermatophilus bullaregiensis]|uniref:VOC family protein n=1 Tax=Geodermatophilus bullaregiensis TaxID=1564160 RepID=UPI0019589850|nr:VOC family protein [Geodermatophilus bullaregiensis]MBM7805333.1 catechol 2,3-dioxygenase-like lactoylglutathione lyase family enzyme [Geodermatophilus bullaregiensis]